MDTFGRSLVWVGGLLVVLGLLLTLAPDVPWLGKLPGDLRIEREGFRLYLPITTCVLLSLVVSLVLQLIARLR